MLLAFSDAVDSVHVEAPVEAPAEHAAPVAEDHTATSVHDTSSGSDSSFHGTYPVWLYVHPAGQSGTMASPSAPCTPSTCQLNGGLIGLGLLGIVIVIGIIYFIARALSQ